jgi:hypothetical protein
MTRWRLVVLAIAVVVAAVAVWCGLDTLVNKKREAGYEAALREYSKDIRPGLTRKDVRRYLRAKHIDYKVLCYAQQCAEMIYLGKYLGPFECAEADVAFEYQPGFPDRDSDVLKAVDLRPFGCI